MSTVGSSSRSSTPDRRLQPRGPTRWKKEEIETDRKKTDSIRRILRVRHKDCVPSVGLHRCLCLTRILALLVQTRLRWFGHAARRPERELIKELLLPTPPRTWRRRTGGQLKTWATTIKADLEPLSGPRVFGYARQKNDWVKVSNELAQDRRAWSASVQLNW